MYHRLMVIVDELNFKMNEFLEDSPEQTDAAFKYHVTNLKDNFEQPFVDYVNRFFGLCRLFKFLRKGFKKRLSL